MFTISRNRRALLRSVSAAAFVAAALSIAATAANAGQCPADKMMPNATKPVSTPAKDVTDKVIAQIDLSKEKVALNDHLFRLRRLEIKPGGVVPWHSHEDRPALIYIVQGQVVEYASNCAVPIVHKAGEVAPETSATAHWWKNTGRTTVILLSADILHDQSDHNM